MTGRGLGVADFRKINLRALIAQYDGPTALAKKLGYSGGAYLLQMVGNKPIRPITEKTARKIEKKLDLPPGWLDRDHTGQAAAGSSSEPPPPVGLNQDLLAKVVSAVGTAADKLGVRLNANKFGDVVALTYEDAVQKNHIDEQRIDRILRLAK